MKHKKYKKGGPFGTFLTFCKEVYPKIINSGKRKVRRGFFRCEHNVYIKISFQEALNQNRKECPCQAKFNGEKIHKNYDKEHVESYSYQKALQWHKQALRTTPAGWLWVSRIGVFLKREDGSNTLFYKFEKTNRTGYDYKAARSIEDITWNRPKKNRAFYLMRLSYSYDNLHREGLMNFKSELWNRGAGIEIFNEILRNE